MDQLKVRLFISYSHKDEKYCHILRKHLTQFERVGLIESWLDQKIYPGSLWDEGIKSEMRRSDIILFLVSPDFLSSEYIFHNEIKQALEQHQSGVSVLVPILLKNCHMELTPLAELQGLPNNLEPVVSKKWGNIDAAFFDITSRLHNLIHREREKKQIKFEEESSWEHAKSVDTPESYTHYVKTSKLKTHVEEAFKRAGTNQLTDYKKAFEMTSLELELERRRIEAIGYELHDNINQTLVTSKLLLEVSLDKANDASRHIVEKAREYISVTIGDIRDIIHLLMSGENPSMSLDFDLERSIDRIIEHHRYVDHISIETAFEGLQTIQNLHLKFNIQRIIKEAIHNIFKHSKATKAKLSVSACGNMLTITISDNGVGLQDDGTIPKKTGIANMELRAKVFGGSFEIKNLPEGGCELRVTIPIQ